MYLLTTFTDNPIYGFFYLFIAVIYVYRETVRRRYKPELVTYLDKSIEAVWKVMGIMSFLSYLIIVAISFFKPVSSLTFAVMMPLVLLFTGMGVSITGILIRNKTLIYTPGVALVMAIIMLAGFVNDWVMTNRWYLLFGAAFLIMMVIPGYMMKYSIKETK